MKFIELQFPPLHHPNGWTQIERSTSLSISDKRPLTAGLLGCLGVIPHGSYFRPKTAADRDALVEFLNALEYPS